MKRLIRYLKKYFWYYSVAIMSMLIGILLDMFNPYLTKVIIDDVIRDGNTAVLNKTLLGLLGITLGRAVLGYTKEYMFDLSSSKVCLSLRKDLFNHIQTLSFAFFDGVNTGELMSRIKEDVENVWRALAFGIMLFVEQIIYFITATILLFTLNWKLAAVSMITMPLIAWIAFRLEARISKVFEKISDQGAKVNTIAQENIAGVRLVKAFGREKYEISKFLEQNQENCKLNIERAGVWADYHPKIEFLSSIVVVLVTAIGGLLVIKEEISVGMLVAFSSYIFMLIWPMRMLGWLTNIVGQCRASVKKIEDIFNQEPTVKSPENPVTLQKFKGHITFKNVSFEYNEAPVLRNITIDAKPGTTIAIMGMTGAGKSTIINLIGRYYDCTSGSICLDGVDIRDLDINTLRRQISIVMQDTFLFSDSIEENIKFGHPPATNENMITAARDAQIHPFISELPEGYETVIGERGIGLSGGQKQRLSIARALLKECKVLVMDDATSALDMETEYEIQNALERRKGVTKFIIAHRISAVKNADEILIVDHGEIVERGTHQQLLMKKGIYYNTFCEQYQGYLDLHEDLCSV